MACEIFVWARWNTGVELIKTNLHDAICRVRLPVRLAYAMLSPGTALAYDSLGNVTVGSEEVVHSIAYITTIVYNNHIV